jgi:hypothetical protein
MRDLTSVLQALYRLEINCRIQSFWDCGFTIVLGDEFNGDRGSFDIAADNLPSAGERLWDLACRHYPEVGDKRVPRPQAMPRKIVHLSRVIIPSRSGDMFPVSQLADAGREADVLSYAVMRQSHLLSTVWYVNVRGEVREELFGRRDPWRVTGSFKTAEEKSVSEFCRLYVASA